MSDIYDSTEPEQREAGLRHAAEALARGELVVLPTDTVYGIAADALNPAAVARLQQAKRRGRQAPPAVLVPDTVTVNRLAVRVPGAVHQLTPRFWPGALTIVLTAQPALEWDLGDNDGTVAVRMPDNELALELLRAAGPLAVSAASAAGMPVATTVAEAVEAFGDAVAVYLDGGALLGAGGDGENAGTPAVSTILDATDAASGGRYRVLRRGVVSVEQLRIALGDDKVLDLEAPAEADALPVSDEDASAER